MRAHFIDRIRVILTILVIAHHSAITYGANGGWFVRLAPTEGPTSLLLTIFVAVNQAFFMGFFFLIAGCFTPISYDLRGWADFSRERLLRLGLPVLVFGFLIGPLTVAIAGNGLDFVRPWITGMTALDFVIGPMWFALALLVFSLGYVVRRRFFPIPSRKRQPIPDHGTWITAALGVGLAALVVRQVTPVGTEILGFQLAYFPSYVFLFVTGLVIERFGWLENVKRRHAMPWLVAAMIAIPLLPLAMVVGQALGQTTFATGFSLPAVFYAFWEPVVAWGIIAGALWFFRRRWGEPNRRWTYLSRQSYGAFILHPPVLVSTALVLEPVPVPAFVKFVMLVFVGSVVSFGLAAVLRRLRIIRRIV